jgi:hypothetical protein
MLKIRIWIKTAKRQPSGRLIYRAGWEIVGFAHFIILKANLNFRHRLNSWRLHEIIGLTIAGFKRSRDLLWIQQQQRLSAHSSGRHYMQRSADPNPVRALLLALGRGHERALPRDALPAWASLEPKWPACGVVDLFAFSSFSAKGRVKGWSDYVSSGFIFRHTW